MTSRTRFTSNFDGLIPVLVALLGAGLLLTAGYSTLGVTPSWAFSFLSYAPDWMRWVAAILIVLAALPQTYGWWSHLRRLRISVWVAAPVAIALFWIFRERTWHGDALYKLALLTTQSLQSDPYVWKEPLDSLLEHSLAAALRPSGIAPDIAVALMSVAAGGFYVVFVGRGAAWLAATSLRRLIYYVGLLATGASLLWFGHIENYSWSTALAFAALILGVGNMRGRAPLWAVGLVGGAAVSFHPQALFVIPAFVVLLRRERWRRQLTTLVLAGVAAPIATVLVFRLLEAPLPSFAGGGFAGDSQLFWTPAQALAPSQLAAVLQNLWLVAPLWPLWIGAGIWGWTQPGLRRDRLFRFMTAAAAGLLVYLFAFQNDLPRARDWDLFAIVGPPLALWGLYTWLQLIDKAPAPAAARTLRQVLAVGLVFASAYGLFWVGVNYAYTLVRPNPAERDLYARYRLVDLADQMAQATYTPDSPICAGDTGCERVAVTSFTMPQSGDRRVAVLAHAPVEIVFPLALPDEPAFLWLSPALDPEAQGWGGDGVRFVVKARTGQGDDLLWERYLSPQLTVDQGWQETFIPLDRYQGQSIDLVLQTDPGPAGDAAADRAGWGMPWLIRGTYAGSEDQTRQ